MENLIKNLPRTPNTPLLVVMIGPSCSGKSTLVNKALLESSGDARCVSRDLVREFLFGTYKMGEENLVTKVCQVQVDNYLKIGDVYVDNTHLNWGHIKAYLERYNVDADVYYHLMPKVPLEDLQRRNSDRELVTGKHIPKGVIEDMHSRYEKLFDEWVDDEVPLFFPRDKKINT